MYTANGKPATRLGGQPWGRATSRCETCLHSHIWFRAKKCLPSRVTTTFFSPRCIIADMQEIDEEKEADEPVGYFKKLEMKRLER